MQHPEFVLLALNLVLVCFAYFVIFPRFCGSDGPKIVQNDVLASVVGLLVAGSLFWGSGEDFSLIFIEVNWFWFTLISYSLIEIPFMRWYFKKHDVWSSFNF
jgi:hypothetical protein